MKAFKILILALIISFLVYGFGTENEEPPPKSPVENLETQTKTELLLVGAFNIQIFGKYKMKKLDVVLHLINILKRYDLVLVQEIRDASGIAIQQLLTKLNEASHDNYQMIISERAGRTSSKEQYAYFYKPSKINVIDSYDFDDGIEPKDDIFQREPFVVRFQSNSGFDFAAVGIHTSPDDAVKEVDELVGVYDDLRIKWGERDALIMGDFNADCSYLKGNDWQEVDLWTDKRFKWWIDNEDDTTVSKTDCAYDRFVSAGEVTKKIEGDGKVFQFDKEYQLNNKDAKRVSDHYPIEVWIEM